MKTFKIKMLALPTHVEIDRTTIENDTLLEMAKALNFNIPLTMLEYDELDYLLRNFRARMFQAANVKDKSLTVLRTHNSPNQYNSDGAEKWVGESKPLVTFENPDTYNHDL